MSELTERIKRLKNDMEQSMAFETIREMALPYFQNRRFQCASPGTMAFGIEELLTELKKLREQNKTAEAKAEAFDRIMKWVGSEDNGYDVAAWGRDVDSFVIERLAELRDRRAAEAVQDEIAQEVVAAAPESGPEDVDDYESQAPKMLAWLKGLLTRNGFPICDGCHDAFNATQAFSFQEHYQHRQQPEPPKCEFCGKAVDIEMADRNVDGAGYYHRTCPRNPRPQPEPAPLQDTASVRPMCPNCFHLWSEHEGTRCKLCICGGTPEPAPVESEELPYDFHKPPHNARISDLSTAGLDVAPEPSKGETFRVRITKADTCSWYSVVGDIHLVQECCPTNLCSWWKEAQGVKGKLRQIRKSDCEIVDESVRVVK